MKYLILVSVIVAALCFGSSAKAAGPCGLNLGSPKFGQLKFAIPEGGKAARQLIAKKLLLCTLSRRDGTLFARLQGDSKGRIFSLIFYRENGTVLQSVSAIYAASGKSAATPNHCSSSSSASISTMYWTHPREWYVGKTVDYINRENVINAIRNAQSEWTNNQNDCGVPDEAKPPAKYIGTTTTGIGHDGKSVVDFGSMDGDQTCKTAVACAVTFTDENGSPNESDIRLNTMYEWAIDGRQFAYDVRSVAAHEIGHTLHFDHVGETNDGWQVMYPYAYQGDTAMRKLGKGDALGNNEHY